MLPVSGTRVLDKIIIMKHLQNKKMNLAKTFRALDAIWHLFIVFGSLGKSQKSIDLVNIFPENSH